MKMGLCDLNGLFFLQMDYLETLLLVSEAKLVVISIPYDLPLDPNDFRSAAKEVSFFYESFCFSQFELYKDQGLSKVLCGQVVSW